MPNPFFPLKYQFKILNFFPAAHLHSDLSVRLFSCTAFTHIHFNNMSKLDHKAAKYVFVGYSLTHKGYKYYDPSIKRMIMSRDVTFFENLPYYQKSFMYRENLRDENSFGQ